MPSDDLKKDEAPVFFFPCIAQSRESGSCSLECFFVRSEYEDGGKENAGFVILDFVLPFACARLSLIEMEVDLQVRGFDSATR